MDDWPAWNCGTWAAAPCGRIRWLCRGRPVRRAGNVESAFHLPPCLLQRPLQPPGARTRFQKQNTKIIQKSKEIKERKKRRIIMSVKKAEKINKEPHLAFLSNRKCYLKKNSNKKLNEIQSFIWMEAKREGEKDKEGSVNKSSFLDYLLSIKL